MVDKKLEVTSADYKDNVSHEQLSEALKEGKSLIVIKDTKKKIMVAVAITLADYLHHGSLIAAVGSINCSIGIHDNLVWCGKPLAVISAIVNIGYYALWKRCPLSNYRIATRPSFYKMLKGQAQPNTVIVLQTEQQSSLMHVMTTLAAVAIAFWEDFSILSNRLQKTLFTVDKEVDHSLSEELANEID